MWPQINSGSSSQETHKCVNSFFSSFIDLSCMTLQRKYLRLFFIFIDIIHTVSLFELIVDCSKFRISIDLSSKLERNSHKMINQIANM